MWKPAGGIYLLSWVYVSIVASDYLTNILTFTNILTLILFLKSLDFNIGTCLTLSESTTIFCRFYDLCFLRVVASRATLFFPEQQKKKLGKRKGLFCFSSGLAGTLSLFSTRSLKFLSQFQLFFSFFLLSFRVSPSTATRASPAPSRVWADAGG